MAHPRMSWLTRVLPRSDAAGSSRNAALESAAIGLGALAFTLVAIVALPVFGTDPAPIAGRGSVGEFAAIASALTAMVAFLTGRYVLHTRGQARLSGALDVLDLAALALAHALIGLLSWTLVADILARAFVDATVFTIPLLALSGAAAAVSAYVAFLSAIHLDAQLLAVVLAVFLVEGILASMLTASDPHWWADNLSSLGITADVSALAFNLTLIIAGFVLAALARYATRAVPTPVENGAARIRTSLIVIGVFLGLVGVFHVDTRFWIHTAVASGMAVAFGVLTVRLRAWVPGISRGFLLVGWGFMAVIVVLAVYFAVGIYTLTAVELVAGTLVFTWIILFLRAISALHADTADTTGTAD